MLSGILLVLAVSYLIARLVGFQLQGREILSRVDGDPISSDLRVVVVGQENLKDGAPVRIVEEAF